MKDLNNEILPVLQNHKIEGIFAGNESIYPHYEGYSLVNLSASFCQLLGIPTFGAQPLAPDILNKLQNGYENIIFMLMDGVRYSFLRSFLDTSAWQPMLKNALFSPLTSITPSTTSAALTTLWTGASPAEHGILGYEVWLKEYGMIANMILHSAFTFEGDTGGLQRAGFDPLTFLPVPTFGPHLLKNGIEPYALQNSAIAYSGLSKMLFPAVNVLPFRSNLDMLVSLEQLMQQPTRSPHKGKFAYMYWETIDTLSHRYGPDDERVYREFEHFGNVLMKTLQHIQKNSSARTLFVVTADHGFIHTPILERYNLTRYPDINQLLVMVPTGENRLPYLFPKNGCSDEVIERLHKHFGDDFVAISSRDAIKHGLFGSGTLHPMLSERLGEWVLVPQQDAYLWWWWQKENPLLGRHGGMSPAEMLIPFLAIDLS